MDINEYIGKIKKLNACGEAIKAALKYKTSQELWADCERGDWMLWLIGKLSDGPGDDRRRLLVLTACACARLVLPFVQKGEHRPLKAIETAEGWAKRKAGVTIEDVKAAAYAAYAASNAAAYAAANAANAANAAYAAAYAANAANAAAYAANAANAAAYAANASNAAAYAAANAANAAAYAANAANAASRKKTLLKCATIVRKNYPDIDLLMENSQ